MYMFKILKYEYKKDTIESYFKINVGNNNYELVYPSNPLVDVDILKLNNMEISTVIYKLNKIKNDTLSIKTKSSFELFLNNMGNAPFQKCNSHF